MILRTKEDCKKVLEKSESADVLNDVRISRDQTYNQRQEARLFRLEKEKEEQEGVTGSQVGRGRGIVRGTGRRPGRPKGSRNGWGVGRGVREADRLESVKRKKSDDESERAEAEEENNKKRRTTTPKPRPTTQTTAGETSTSSSILAPIAATAQKPPPPQLQSVTARPGTPHPTPRLAAAEAEDQQSF